MIDKYDEDGNVIPPENRIKKDEPLVNDACVFKFRPKQVVTPPPEPEKLHPSIAEQLRFLADQIEGGVYSDVQNLAWCMDATKGGKLSMTLGISTAQPEEKYRGVKAYYLFGQAMRLLEGM